MNPSHVALDTSCSGVINLATVEACSGKRVAAKLDALRGIAMQLSGVSGGVASWPLLC